MVEHERNESLQDILQQERVVTLVVSPPCYCCCCCCCSLAALSVESPQWTVWSPYFDFGTCFYRVNPSVAGFVVSPPCCWLFSLHGMTCCLLSFNYKIGYGHSHKLNIWLTWLLLPLVLWADPAGRQGCRDSSSQKSWSGSATWWCFCERWAYGK